jgi:hypothetical protein
MSIIERRRKFTRAFPQDVGAVGARTVGAPESEENP